MTKRDRRWRRVARLLPSLAWTDRPALTPIQHMIWERASRIQNAESVALAGSGALAVHGYSNREVQDIDLFTDNGPEVYHVYDTLVKALRAEGYTVDEAGDAAAAEWKTRRSMYVTTSVGGRTKVDIGTQIRIHTAAVTDAGLRLLQLDDIAAGKMGALHDRAYPKDVVDVEALTVGHYTLTELCAVATEREPRFDRARLARRLVAFLEEGRHEEFDERAEHYRLKMEDWIRELRRGSPEGEPELGSESSQ